jgi:hypothetical protein
MAPEDEPLDDELPDDPVDDDPLDDGLPDPEDPLLDPPLPPDDEPLVLALPLPDEEPLPRRGAASRRRGALACRTRRRARPSAIGTRLGRLPARCRGDHCQCDTT